MLPLQVSDMLGQLLESFSNSRVIFAMFRGVLVATFMFFVFLFLLFPSWLPPGHSPRCMLHIDYRHVRTSSSYCGGHARNEALCTGACRRDRSTRPSVHQLFQALCTAAATRQAAACQLRPRAHQLVQETLCIRPRDKRGVRSGAVMVVVM